MLEPGKDAWRLRPLIEKIVKDSKGWIDAIIMLVNGTRMAFGRKREASSRSTLQTQYHRGCYIAALMKPNPSLSMIKLAFERSLIAVDLMKETTQAARAVISPTCQIPFRGFYGAPIR